MKTGPLRNKPIIFIPLILFWLFSLGQFICAGGCWSESRIPDNFVDVRELIPTLILDMRYSGPHNFVGEKIDGYTAPKCILTRNAAAALARVQDELNGFLFALKVYDCYRPKRAVNHFMRWAKDVNDTRTRREFYSTVAKENLFRDGYIAEKSGHSRGSTVDVTIVPMPTPRQEPYVPGQPLHACYLPVTERFGDNSIDMGTGFDCFHERSHTANSKIGVPQRINRLLLKTLMEKQGFKNYEKEWWHFTLREEPFPDTYFDFVIE